MRKVVRKLILFILITSSILCLSGCGSLEQYVVSELGSALHERFAFNQSILDRLYGAGMITKAVYDDCTESIEKQLNSYLKSEGGQYCIEIDPDNPLGNPLVNSVSEYYPIGLTHVLSEDGKKFVPVTSMSQIESVVISNFLAACIHGSGGYVQYGEDGTVVSGTDQWYTERREVATPIQIIPNTNELFDNLVDYNVYVLNPDILTADGTGGIDNIISTISSLAGTKESDAAKLKTLDKFFVQAVDENGEKISMMDILDIDGVVKVSESYDGSEVPIGENGESGNRPGYDLMVNQTVPALIEGQQSSVTNPVLKIKFQEFDSDAINKLLAAVGSDMNDGLSTQKWVVLENGTEHNVYLMEYPVYYISGMQNCSDKAGYVEGILEESDIGINLYTGNIINYVYDDEGELIGCSVVENEELDYLTMEGAESLTADTLSSFFVSGIAETEIGNGDNKKNVITGRVILRDYLEIVYASNFGNSDNTNVHVFGRKLRYTNIEELKGTTEAVQIKKLDGLSDVVKYYENLNNEEDYKKEISVLGYQVETQEQVVANYEAKLEKWSTISIEGLMAEIEYDSREEAEEDKIGKIRYYTEELQAAKDRMEELKTQKQDFEDRLKFMEEVNVEDLEVNFISVPYNMFHDSTGRYKQTRIVFDKQNKILEFVDSEGYVIEGTTGLKVEDLCDINYLMNNNVVVRLENNELSSGKEYSVSLGYDEGEDSTDSLNSLIIGNYIQTAARFPGPVVGMQDYVADKEANALKFSSANEITVEGGKTHQVFYGIMVNSDLFDTALFSTWLYSNEERASLKWWNNWLAENNYLYKISINDLMEYLKENFTHELNEHGITILDLELISKIQKEMREEKDTERSGNIVTLFRVFGWCLICYSMILVMCWIVDTHVDLGVALTNKITFGLWEPVKYIEDVPHYDAENRKYVGFSRLIMCCSVIMLVGVLLVVLNIYDVVMTIIEMLGRFAIIVDQMLNGMK